jgi:hypothetical protein
MCLTSLAAYKPIKVIISWSGCRVEQAAEFIKCTKLETHPPKVMKFSFYTCQQNIIPDRNEEKA